MALCGSVSESRCPMLLLYPAGCSSYNFQQTNQDREKQTVLMECFDQNGFVSKPRHGGTGTGRDMVECEAMYVCIARRYGQGLKDCTLSGIKSATESVPPPIHQDCTLRCPHNGSFIIHHSND